MAKELNLNFMKGRHVAMALSAILLIVAIAALAIRGLNLGLDFTGGTLLEVSYEQPAKIENIRSQLDASGFLGSTVQHFGSETDILIRMSEAYRDTLGQEVLQALREGDESNPVELRRSEFVGGQVGEELRDQGGLALLMALFVVMLYVSFRFQFKFVRYFFSAFRGYYLGAFICRRSIAWCFHLIVIRYCGWWFINLICF